MSTLVPGSDVRTVGLGYRATSDTGTLANSTTTLFTVAGGRVLLTSVYGLVTTAITVANSYKLQHNPTTGTTVAFCDALDIGTTDTAAGELLGITMSAAGGFLSIGGAVQTLGTPLVLAVGDIESVSTGTDGAITWVVTWMPLDDGASLVAS